MIVVTNSTCERLQVDSLPAVTAVSTLEYEEALERMLDLCRRYRTVRATVHRESSDVGTVWAPIYVDLLHELRRELEICAMRYGAAADEAGMDASSRLVWRQVLELTEPV